MKFFRLMFRILNKFFMVPVFRLGLGALIVNPLSGYIMVMKMTGHKSGLTRWVPVNYAIHNSFIYCLSGMGNISHWYKNLKANPKIDVILPGRTIAGTAIEVEDPAERLDAARKIMIASGFAAFLSGINVFKDSDDEFLRKTKEMIVFRIQPVGLGVSPHDSGEWGWIAASLAWLLPLAALLYWLLR